MNSCSKTYLISIMYEAKSGQLDE